MEEIVKYHNCFVCGDRNPQGLKARFFYDGRQAITEVSTDVCFEGYRGVFHGGIISTLLDEVMIKAILAEQVYAVTAEITVKFVKPVMTGEKLRLAGRIVSRKGRLYLTEGEATSARGEVCVRATGKYLEARPELKTLLVESLDQN